MNPRSLLTAALFCSGALATTLLAAPALAADVGVSVSIGQPGFYGRIDVGEAPRPRVLYRQPVVIERVQVEEEPIYLHVPPGHARRWRHHCHEYDACGRRVYFVRDDWYNNYYAPRYRERHHDHGDDDSHHDRRHDRRDDRDDDHHHDRDDRDHN